MLAKSGNPYPPAQENTPTRVSEEAVPSYSSEALFGGQKEIRIDHQGSIYRLRITRTGGMILNK